MRRASLHAWVERGTVVALCAAGAAFRIPGLTTRDLWFDDAWGALPARVGLAEAMRMVVTTPLFTLALRSWIELHPDATWFDQLPELAMGIAGIAAVWALVRALGFGRLAACAAAAVIAAGPVTTIYSTRVKEYSCDLLLSCLVLWLCERWRRAPSARSAAWLAIGSAVAIATSASTAAIVGGAAVCAVLVAWHARELRAQVAAVIGVLGVVAIALWAVVLRRIPSELRTNWRTHGYLFGYSSARHVAYEFQQTFSGLVHGLVGAPIPYTFSGYAIRVEPMALAIATLLVLAAIVTPPLIGAVRSRGATVPPAAPAAAAMVLGVIGTLLGLAPLGDGRTDEAFYPAILVLSVAAATALWRRVPTNRLAARAAPIAVAAVVGVATVWFGATHTEAYPPTGLSTVAAELFGAHGPMRPGDVVVVDGYESFTWALDGVTPWRVSFAQPDVPWPMGFHVVSADHRVILSASYLQPPPDLASLLATARRVWFIGPNVGGYSTAAPRSLWSFPFRTPTLIELEALGWRAGAVCCHASGTYVELFTKP